MSFGPYFTGKTGGKHFFMGIAEVIRNHHPEVRGQHIFNQLNALGLDEEFNGGVTPYSLPYSFSDYEGEKICCIS